MKYPIVLIVLLIWILFFKTSAIHSHQYLIKKSLKIDNCKIADTCIIEGLAFEFVEKKAPNPLKGIIKNGRIQVFDLQGNEKNFRVIRYVFSVKEDARVSSVRHYGDLVSYPVLQILKDAQIDEIFYFEEIIIVDENKEILNNAVRSIIIKRIAN